MRADTQHIIEKIGETDQLFLQANQPELALQRADLRLQLVQLSQVRQEQEYFLKEAIVLLEQARFEFEEMPMQLYLDLSSLLGQAYLKYFEISHERRYALIAQQILKPLAKALDGNILFYLAYASAAQQEPAMMRHWLNKYMQTDDCDITRLKNHSAFEHYHQTEWFQQLLQSKLH